MHCSDLREEDTGLGTTSRVWFESQVFRVLLVRRHWLHLLLAPRNCRCGCRLDSSGHHRTACVKKWEFWCAEGSLESAATRVCREAGGRASLPLCASSRLGLGCD